MVEHIDVAEDLEQKVVKKVWELEKNVVYIEEMESEGEVKIDGLMERVRRS